MDRINKILVPLVIVCAICSVGIAVVALALFNQLITENMTQAIEISSTMVEEKFDTYKSRTKLAAENMKANQEFVDGLRDITGCEISIYLGETCVVTTLIDSVTGERPIDITADNDVSGRVLSGQSYIEKTKLMGKDALVKYFPIYDGVDKQAIGMLCVGKYSDNASEGALSLVKNSMIAMLLILTAVTIVVTFTYRSRINGLQGELNAVSSRTQDNDDASGDIHSANSDSLGKRSGENHENFISAQAERMRRGGYEGKKGPDSCGNANSHGDYNSQPGSLNSDKNYGSYSNHTGKSDSFDERDTFKKRAIYDTRASNENHDNYDSRDNYDSHDSYGSCSESSENYDNAESANSLPRSHGTRIPITAETDMPKPVSWGIVTRLAGKDISALKRGSRSFSDIIDMSNAPQVKPKKIEIVLANYVLSSLIDDVISDIRMRTANSSIRFALNIDSNLPSSLVGDPIRIRQIVLDIISFATKSAQKANIYLGIHGEIKDRDIVELKIIVMDISMINQAEVERLLGDSIQLDLMHGEGIEGTYMELVVTQKLIQAMDGNIYVSSEYGKRTKFVILLPQKYTSADKLACVKNPQEMDALVFERRELYAASLKLSMRNLGVECACVSTSRELAEKLTTHKYSFVFIASYLFEKNQNILSRIPTNTIIVLLTEQGNVIGDKDLITLTIPAHTISIANILNSAADNSPPDWAIIPTTHNGNRMLVDQREEPHIPQGMESLQNELHILREALNDLGIDFNIDTISGSIGNLRQYVGRADVGDDVKNVLQKLLIGDYNAAGVLIDVLLKRLR